MRFSIRFADKIVGTLVVLALAIMIFVIFMLGRNQRWFVHDYQYITYFNSASGLSANMAVQFRGFTIGNIKRIFLAEDDRVEVIFTIFNEHNHRVKEGSVVELIASPIGLGNSFIFHPGRGSELLEEGSVIPEINSLQARLLLAAGLVDRPESSGDSINNIVNQVTALLETVNLSIAGPDPDNPVLGQILSNVESATGSVDDIVQEISVVVQNTSAVVQNITAQLNPIMRNLETVTAQISDPSGTVMTILDSEGPIVTDLTAAISSITGIIENLEKTSDFIPAQLPQLVVLIAELDTALRTVQDVLTAVANHPLLRGGIPQRQQTSPGGANPRNLEF